MTVAKAVAAVLLGMALGASAPALGHGSNHREVITSQGYAHCAEDERLVPVRHHGYVPERTGGWVYVCQNFEVRGKWAR